MDLKKIGARIKEMRTDAGMTQAEFAAQIGVSRPALGYYEQGQREMTIATACKIADVLGCTTDELLDHNVDELQKHIVYCRSIGIDVKKVRHIDSSFVDLISWFPRDCWDSGVYILISIPVPQGFRIDANPPLQKEKPSTIQTLDDLKEILRDQSNKIEETMKALQKCANAPTSSKVAFAMPSTLFLKLFDHTENDEDIKDRKSEINSKFRRKFLDLFRFHIAYLHAGVTSKGCEIDNVFSEYLKEYRLRRNF